MSNKPTTIGEIKSFVKRASGSGITNWLGEIYRSGYRQGMFDQIAKQLEEKPVDTESAESEQEQAVDGSLPSD